MLHGEGALIFTKITAAENGKCCMANGCLFAGKKLRLLRGEGTLIFTKITVARKGNYCVASACRLWEANALV